MKLSLFGATGKVGRSVIELALAEGHRVTALARRPENLPARDGLEVLQGDVTDYERVLETVTGADAVVCALGMPLFNGERLRERGTRVIVDAMQAAGVQRIVCVSALGTGDSKTLLPAHYRYFLAPFVMRRMFADHNAQEQILRDSGLDWTVARPGNFVEKAPGANYRHGFTAPFPGLSLSITCGDVADFLVKQLTDDRYLRSAAALSY